MQALFNRVLKKHIRPRSGDRILVALSGGADSVVLLDLLLRASAERDLGIVAAHLDHGMRAESRRDADFVRDLCRRLGVPLTVERRDVPALAAVRKQGLEEAARDERRAFLAGTALLEGCRFVALGHHRDDQAETFLQRLLRGSGLTGLAGMRLRTDPFIRPLLPFSRDEIHRYLAARHLPYVEDLSNADTAFTRNRLRHELLPALRGYNPRIDEHLSRLSRLIALEEEYWEQQVEVALEALCSIADDGIRLCRGGLLQLHPALRARVLRGALERVRGDLRAIGARHIEAIEDLLQSGKPEAETHLPGAWAARRYGRLWLRAVPPAVAEAFAIEIPGPGVYDLPCGGRLHVLLEDAMAGEDRWSVEFDADAVPFPLLVRPFRPGDRFYPDGAPGHRKLKDFFIDIKLEREFRRSLPLVVADEILWLPGVRRCHGRRPHPGSAKVLRLAAIGLRMGNQSL
jgi:tRNA(Ile)-lysidine synthase